MSFQNQKIHYCVYKHIIAFINAIIQFFSLFHFGGWLEKNEQKKNMNTEFVNIRTWCTENNFSFTKMADLLKKNGYEVYRDTEGKTARKSDIEKGKNTLSKIRKNIR